MTKKQYFVFLWALSSISPLMSIVQRRLMNYSSFGYGNDILSIFLYGFIVFFGIYFAQQIGARLLFLDERYNFINDILKPAVFVGIGYAGVALMINALIPISPIDMFLSRSSSLSFLDRLFLDIKFDFFYLLFCVPGLAFIIKKIAKDASMSVVMPISIGLVLFCVNAFRAPTDSLFIVATFAVLSALFWKKGFETALLCHVVIATILYLIAPAVVLALGAQ